MFEKYTEPARRVIFFARYEASGWGYGEIGAEHILLGICRQDRAALARFGFTDADALAKLADAIRATLPKIDLPSSGDMELSESSQNVLAAAAEFAANRKIRPSDLLEAISRQHGTPAARLLQQA